MRDCVVDFICHMSARAVEADRDIHDLQKKKGSLRIAVIKTFCTRISRTDSDFHGFFKGFSVPIRQIREFRVQNHGNSQRARRKKVERRSKGYGTE